MSYGLETMGGLVGGLIEGTGGLAKGAVLGGGAGAVTGGLTGGALAGTAGLATGPGDLVIAPAGVATGATIGLVGGAAVGGGIGMVAGAKQGVADGSEYGKRLGDWITQMTTADDRAKRQSKVETSLDTACATCGCSKLAAGIPGTPYRGGAHAFTQVGGDKIQSHHMPPAAVSPLPADVGPAIQMDTNDHYDTPSFGRNRFAPFMQSQGLLANTGQFMTAFEVDAAAVETKFPGKYTGAIEQARAYAQCLQKAGMVK